MTLIHLGAAGSAPHPILGRETELAAIDGHLGSGGLAWVIGDAGIGKSTLWAAAVTSAISRDVLVLAATPAEAEASFTYAVLGDLLADVWTELSKALPRTHRATLASLVFAGGPTTKPELQAVSVALRAALSTLVATRPTLVAIDDAQWVDRDSAVALDYALRRVGEVAVLIASRRGMPVELHLGAPTLDVGPLPAPELHRLIRERLALDLERAPLLRLVAVSGGNPFYALELARAYRPGSPIEAPASLTVLLAERLRSLDARSMRAVGRMALAGIAHRGAVDGRALSHAVDAGVLRRTADGYGFEHPLLAEGVVASLTSDARRRLHRAIARDLPADDDQRLRHLALGSDAPDPALAGELQAAAERAERRGTYALAEELWRLAAASTPIALESLAAERHIHVGIAGVLSGHPFESVPVIAAWIDRAPAGSARDRGRVYLAVHLAADDQRAPIAPLQRVLKEATDPHVRREIVQLLSAFLDFTGDARRGRDVVREFLAEVEGTGDTDLLFEALVTAADQEIRVDGDPWQLIERARRLRGAAQEQPHAAWLPAHVTLAAYVREGRLDPARRAFKQEADRPGTVFQEGADLAWVALLEIAEGHPERARVHAEQALAIAEQLRAPFQICSALKYATVAALLMGDAGGALATGRRLLEYAAGQHASALVDDACFCLGLTELSRGDPVRAAEWYRQVSPSSWRLWNHIAGARPHVDAIEALAHTGDLETARDLSATLPPDARERVLAQAILAGSAGDPDSAVEVLRSLPANEVPFRRAREALLLGRYLRQGRRRRAAREAFLDARTTFEAIASSLWVDRVDAELARVGGRQRVADRLTETERQVAERAAAGRTNKEIASDLGIAVRTAEAHLSSVYVKLGLQSRVELAARWHAVLAPERAYGTAAGRSTIVDLRNGRARRLAIASPPLGSRDRQDDEAAGRG